MFVKEWRSGSQILFGFLPQQTVDLRGRVWKVKSWNTVKKAIEDRTLRHQLRSQAAPWAAAGNDGNFVNDLHQGHSVEVHSLDKESGVRIETFPKVWICKRCSRGATDETKACKCGKRNWGQFHFVGVHECGAIRAPYLPRCPQHNDVQVVFPGTASAAEIRFQCPVCKNLLRQGLGMPNCECGNGRMTFTVHRAASVYTPRTVVVVNAPSRELSNRLSAAGGGTRALTWVVEGLTTRSFEDLGPSSATFRHQLEEQNFAPELIETLVQQAVAAGQFDTGTNIPLERLAGEKREDAEHEAVTIALALAESRVRVGDMAQRSQGALKEKYAIDYPRSVSDTRLDAIELVDKFPVLTGSFGYTRGDSTPGVSRLVPFRARNGNYMVYADVAETEALFVRLRPRTVARWLEHLGAKIAGFDDDIGARLAILEKVDIPMPGEDADSASPGGWLLRLIHSLSHRFIRQAALHSGIERTSLAELLVPRHLGFFVYAAARGDFILGGLQAVFEQTLDDLLADVVEGEHRCPLDPGCSSAGGACMACLHLGEPSCRYYNRYLSRSDLWGSSGFFDF